MPHCAFLLLPFGDAARMALGDTAGAIVSFCAAAGCLGSLGGLDVAGGSNGESRCR